MFREREVRRAAIPHRVLLALLLLLPIGLLLAREKLLGLLAVDRSVELEGKSGGENGRVSAGDLFSHESLGRVITHVVEGRGVGLSASHFSSGLLAGIVDDDRVTRR